MNKKNLFLAVGFIFQTAIATGQYLSLVEESKYWIYVQNYGQDSPQIASGFLIKFEGDTIIDNIVYKKVIRQDLSGTHPCPPANRPCFELDVPYKTLSYSIIGFAREVLNDKKIYFLPAEHNFCSQSEHLIFDFSLAIGDTLGNCQREALGGYPEFGIIENISTELVFNKYRNTLKTVGFVTYIGLPYYDTIQIYEGFGYSYFGLFHEPNNLSGLYDFCEGTLEHCNIISSVADLNATEETLVISPNPCHDQIQISAKSNITSIELFTVTGTRTQYFMGETNLELSHVPQGVYWVKINFANENSAYRKLLKI